MDENPNDVIACAKTWIAQHGAYKYGPPIQALMELISGVPKYKMIVSTDQGYIYRKLIRSMEHNHIVDIETMVSKFWYGAIQAVLRAQPLGTEVDINNGTVERRRKTGMAPLTYIRNMGVAAARKYIDECCRRRLKQVCHDCSKITSLGKQFETDNGCRCGHKESVLPRAFVRHPLRTCTKCHEKRALKFERVCGTVNTDKETGEQWISKESGCGSNNVTIIQIEDFVEDGENDAWEWKFGVTDNNPETEVAEIEMMEDVNRFTTACIAALPGDVADPAGDSQTRKILRVLVDPTAGIDICKQCHIEDPECCGAPTFSIEVCTNYSKKLGQYFGYSTTLANRRVKKIRKHTLKFANEHQDEFITAKYLASRMSP